MEYYNNRRFQWFSPNGRDYSHISDKRGAPNYRYPPPFPRTPGHPACCQGPLELGKAPSNPGHAKELEH
jgi:hypothetical protein